MNLKDYLKIAVISFPLVSTPQIFAQNAPKTLEKGVVCMIDAERLDDITEAIKLDEKEMYTRNSCSVLDKMYNFHDGLRYLASCPVYKAATSCSDGKKRMFILKGRDSEGALTKYLHGSEINDQTHWGSIEIFE